MKTPELLAPAKDLETGITAINCGADAVYIGASMFGARSAAGNSPEDIEKLINYAHKYWAKVYITINTLLNDTEIEEAGQLIHRLYEAGADAIIIQDMGLLELDLPPVPLFASTQCHNNTWQKVDFLEKTGFKRVILPRELTLEQIKDIKNRTNVDLEFFVHGALCVCYSGQCYMSYTSGGRSGNRGDCAQPCRKAYTLTDSSGKIIAKDKYLLSLKDLNLSDCLDELVEAGISSFKIEGRLKDANYIKNIVSYYRHRIDKTADSFGFNPDKTFNRGFTKYFLTGRRKDITAFDSPKHVGEPIGLIENAKLNNGDGITFFGADGELQGTNRPETVKKGTYIYRNYDHEYLKQLKSVKIERKITIKLELNKEYLVAEDENDNRVEYKINEVFEPAKDSEKALQNIEKQLLKLGETAFYAENINIMLDTVPFIPVSKLNEMRRAVVSLLEQERERNYPRLTCKITPGNYPYPQTELDFTGNALNKYAVRFYTHHGVEKIAPAAESGLNMTGKRLMTTKHCLRYAFNLCGKSSEPMYLVAENKKYRLEFDCKNCEMHVY